ncbi:MAG: alpha-galactosidase, partial [Planctomycetes bacterium]|nr:alpha-galactosidase [Planctomycetota bacterium]
MSATATMSGSFLKIDTISGSEVLLKGSDTCLRFETLSPVLGGVECGNLDFRKSSIAPATVGGVKGEVEGYRSLHPGIEVVREIFRAGDDSFVAIRMGVKNRGGDAFNLGAMIPLCARGIKNVWVNDAAYKDWCVYRMSRQKNDIPGVYRPGVNDNDMVEARVDGAEIKAGMGVSDKDAAAAVKPGAIKSEPGVCIMDDRNPEGQGLFIASLCQSEHLSRVVISGNDEAVDLEKLMVLCELDGVELAPGAERYCHWIIIAETADVREMVARHGVMIGTEMGFEKPNRPAPAVYCSWYFYGSGFTEDDLAENLADLARRPIPFDALLIDHGWMDNFGTWNSNSLFPSGMAEAAGKIRAAGYTPGIWTCPFVLTPDSPILEKYPMLVARDAEGKPVIFPHSEGEKWILDPTVPEAEEYLTEMFTRFKSWGFLCHKLDFLRAVINAPSIQFHDRTMTRAQAYRRGMGIIKNAVGEEGYVLACGGLFEGTIGVADGIRIGSDVKGRWKEPAGAKTHYSSLGYLVRIKQNLYRNYMNDFWHTDPDALQLRRRKGPFRGQLEFEHLADGSLTDDEAFTCVVSQYLGGGLVCFSERMVELDDDRLALLRHVIPATGKPAKILDYKKKVCPETFITTVTAEADGLGMWYNLTLCNWADEKVKRSVNLSAIPESAGKKFALFEFATQKFLGLMDGEGTVEINVPAHGSRV